MPSPDDLERSTLSWHTSSQGKPDASGRLADDSLPAPYSPMNRCDERREVREQSVQPVDNEQFLLPAFHMTGPR